MIANQRGPHQDLQTASTTPTNAPPASSASATSTPAMDRAVLDAYGWTDILPVYDFRPQLDESIRLTWAEDTRDEVLARLLELNRVMAEREARKPPRRRRQRPARSPPGRSGGARTKRRSRFR